jgi:F-type H+-transporting ATPase subunit gamma
MLAAGRTAAVAKVQMGAASEVGKKVISRGFAVNPQEIMKRIVSTGNIKKITSSMKMVSAAKLKGDQRRMENGLVFATGFDGIFEAEDDPENPPAKMTYEFEFAESEWTLRDAEKPTTVVFSSDRGLCGGVNSAVAKACRIKIDQEVAAGKEADIVIVGDKGRAQIARTHSAYVNTSIDEAWKDPMNFDKACAIAQRVVAASADSDRIDFIFNQFVSVIKYDTVLQGANDFSSAIDSVVEGAELPKPICDYELEPEVLDEVLVNMFEYGVALKCYGSAIQNATSEQSSRMQAMENASKNAGEMMDKLTIQYNRARQARITTELIEIISGAESLKG